MTTRRKFLKATASVALLPLVTLPVHRTMAAEKVPVDDPTAKALKYVEDATTATRADKMGTPGNEQVCTNCNFYKADPNNPGWGGCALFRNRLVAGPGWCAGWVPVQS